MCSGKKTKVLVIWPKNFKKQTRQKNPVGKNVVGGHRVQESESEHLLGLIVNNVLTWEHHLCWNEEYKGSSLNYLSGQILSRYSGMAQENRRL